MNSADYDGGMLFLTFFEFWLIFCLGAHCGKTVWVQSNESKKIVEAKIADLCPSCEHSSVRVPFFAHCLLGGGDGQSGIDLSEGLFSALGEKYRSVDRTTSPSRF